MGEGRPASADQVQAYIDSLKEKISLMREAIWKLEQERVNLHGIWRDLEAENKKLTTHNLQLARENDELKMKLTKVVNEVKTFGVK